MADKFTSFVQSGDYLWLAYCVVLVWLKSEAGLVEFIDVNRQLVVLNLEGMDGTDEGETTVVGDSVVCAESAYIIELHMDSTDPVNEGIDCLSNLRSYYNGGKRRG